MTAWKRLELRVAKAVRIQPQTASRSYGPVTVRCTVTPQKPRIENRHMVIPHRYERPKWYIYGIRVPTVFIRCVVAPIIRAVKTGEK